MFLHSISQKPFYCFACIGRCIPALIILCEKIYKIMPTLQCTCSIHFKHQSYFVHSIQSHPCPILHYPIIPLKETKCACGRFFHFDAFRFGRSLLASAPDPSTPLHLHSISHLSPKKQECFAHLPHSAYPKHYTNFNHPFLYIEN